MVTIHDIAARAHVSAMTVSRVIHDPEHVSEKTRERVLRVMEELHDVPNTMAPIPVQQEAKMLFLLVTDIRNPFHTTLIRGAEDAAAENGFRLLLGNSDESLDKESACIETILNLRVDGALIAPSGDGSLPSLERLARHKVPFVLLDREVPGIDCDIVLGDSISGARQLVGHLAELGHRRIALVNGSLSVSSARDRQEGYREALKTHGIPCDERYMLEAGFGLEHDPSAIETWLKGLDPMPTAIVAGNNALALHVFRLLRAAGFGVPEDGSVVCFDDFGPFAGADPFFTVAAQQAYQFGHAGMRLLVERIRARDEDRPRKRIVLPTALILRNSTAPPKA